MSTLKKIAKIANCSVSTVSRAINNCYDISEATRSKILKIAKEQGYFQSKKRIKSENRKKNQFNIAIICPEIESSFYSGSIALITSELLKLGCRSLIYNFSFDSHEFEKLISICQEEMKIDAIVSFESIENINPDKGIPIISFGESDNTSFVRFDTTTGYYECLESLKARGYKSVCFVGEKLTLNRQIQFLHSAKSLDIEVFPPYLSSARFERAGEEAADYFLKQGALPSAFVCAYDEIALGLIDVLSKSGLKIPEDVSVIGTNDVPCAKYCFGGLSTLRFHFEQICSDIVNDLINEIKTKRRKPQKYTITTKFTLRNT